MSKKVFHGASGLSNCIGQRDAAFFNGYKNCPCSKWLTDRRKTLASMFVTMKFRSASMDNRNR
jgi:hypothetical protein